jgi:recombination protein RecA
MSRKKLAETDEEIAPELPERRPGARVFAEIAKRSKIFRPAREVLRRVRAVPTIMTAVDYKLRVGGWPTDRVGVVHGPSGKGKTTFAQGVGLSFLKRGHAYRFVDAEMTTPSPWVEQLFGAYADDPAFMALCPDTFEQAMDGVRQDAEEQAELRDRGKLPKDTTCLYVVDSLGKLVPKDIQAQIDKVAADSKDGSADGMKGAAGMIRALKAKGWLDQLTPLMRRTGCAMLFIVREARDKNATARDRQFGSDWRVTGGDSLIYDASLEIRISAAMMVHEIAYPKEGWRASPIVGEKHVVEIRKTKVSARLDVVEETYFHVSNGAWSPEGFDRARDLLELGLELGVVRQGGSWITYGGNRWQGARRFLTGAKPELLDALECDVRAKFGADVAERADVVGG